MMAQGKVEICGVNTSKLPLLTEGEKEELLDRIKEGDEEAKDRYIKGNLRLVLSVIKRFSASNENPDDLFQIGCIGLCKAAATDKGGCFSTYAYRLIWNEICTALISATRKASGEQPVELPILEIRGAEESLTSTLELEDLLERGERAATGVVKKGIQAMRLRVNGYSTREIGVHLGAPDNYVTAWEAKARKYLRAMN